MALDLGDLDLLGAFSGSVANLTFMRRLHLPGNRLHGAVPSALGHLREHSWLPGAWKGLLV
ncbi:hypothetical protein TRIUR3_05478 [Triticum urartu]|uniref:Uncharacterized protein n=1 Tax=Triticum urartu TaxID=4572 RepID=M8AA36_TRIUA|nr:hypothetical protein TRIUR3_05478 [Triticum urartu]